MTLKVSCFLILVSMFIATPVLSQTGDPANWPRFRGSKADGVGAENDGLPSSWTATENVKWIADVPGWGWSCPVVWEDKVFITSVIADERNLTPSKGLYLGQGVRDPAKGVHHWMVYCFDLNTGREIWKHEAHTGKPVVPRHPKSSYAAETCATDGERVYVVFGDLGLYCYDLDGRPVWSKEIEPRKTLADWGAASSPVVHDDQVFVLYDNLEGSWLAAFDSVTGEERWRTERDEVGSWATPFVWENELRTELVVAGKKRNRSYSLDGELLWEFDGKMSNLVIPSPFAAHGMCFIASGYVGDRNRPTMAIKPGAEGDITPSGDDFAQSEFIEWHQPRSAPYNTTQIVYGEYLYTLYDQGFFTCHDAKTGEEVYGKQRFSPRGSFTSSPWAYGGSLFCLSEDGLTYVVKAGPEFEIVGLNELDELCLASPAIVGDKLLIRTASKLYCMTEGAILDPSVASEMDPRREATTATDIGAAVASGDLDEVKRFVTNGADIESKRIGSDLRPLNLAAVHGHKEIAGYLIEQGADITITNAEGSSPLHIAAFFGHPELVQLLLDNDASTTATNSRGETPLDVVSGEWTDELEEACKSAGDAMRMELDLERIKEARPHIAEMLRGN